VRPPKINSFRDITVQTWLIYILDIGRYKKNLGPTWSYRLKKIPRWTLTCEIRLPAYFAYYKIHLDISFKSVESCRTEIVCIWNNRINQVESYISKTVNFRKSRPLILLIRISFFYLVRRRKYAYPRLCIPSIPREWNRGLCGLCGTRAAFFQNALRSTDLAGQSFSRWDIWNYNFSKYEKIWQEPKSIRNVRYPLIHFTRM